MYFIRKLSNRTKKVKIGLFSHQFNDSKLRELITVENARKTNSQIKTIIEKGEEFNRKDNTLTETESFTVDDAMEQFIELFKIDIKTGLRVEQSLVRIVQNYNNHIKKHLGNKQFTAVAKIEIENPVCSGSLKKVPSTKRTRFLQPSEMKKFFEAVLEEDLIYQDVILYLLFTAQRKINVLSMKWIALDLKNGLWHLTKKEVKGKNAIAVPLNNIIITRLANRYHHCDKNSDYVFPVQDLKQVIFLKKQGKVHFGQGAVLGQNYGMKIKTVGSFYMI